MKPTQIPLSKAPLNKSFTVISIPDSSVRTQLIRFGISIGTKIKCFQKLPSGPLLVKYYKQEIAIGREIADHIIIETT
jgi:Fe2+ transport system protein FeoA